MISWARKHDLDRAEGGDVELPVVPEELEQVQVGQLQAERPAVRIRYTGWRR